MAEFTWTLATTPSSSLPAERGNEHPRVFRRIFRKLLPSWLTTGEGERVHFSLGLIEDAFAERARQGLLARYPEYAPDDALPYIGRDRKIVRGIGEPRASYVPRLLSWLDTHPRRGNPLALLEQLRDYCQTPGIRIRTVDASGNWFALERDGSFTYSLKLLNWDWDGKPRNPYFSRFWVIIYPTAEGAPWEIRGPDATEDELFGLDKLTTTGTTATPEHVAGLRAIVREWQPDGTRCEWIVIAFDDASFDPTIGGPVNPGTWANWGKSSGGHLIASRLSTARYIAGVDGGRRGTVT